MKISQLLGCAIVVLCLCAATTAQSADWVGTNVLFYRGNGSAITDTTSLLSIHYNISHAVYLDDRSTWPGSLADYKLVYLAASTTAYSSAQIDDISVFLTNGGRLVLVGEWNLIWSGQSVFNSLLATLGSTMAFNADFWDPGCGTVTTSILADQITAGVTSLDIQSTCSINPGSGTPILLDSTGTVTTGAVEATDFGPRPGFDIVVLADTDLFVDTCSPTNGLLWSNLYTFTPTGYFTTTLTLDTQTLLSKSVMNFTVCYTNNSGQVLGDDETVENQLRALLFANSKSAGDFTALLDPIPTLGTGTTYCDTFSATVPVTTKSKKVQKILRIPMRTEVRVKIDGTVAGQSQSYAAFRIEERDLSDQYWMIDNDEGHDIDISDGLGGTTQWAYEIGPDDTVFANEDYFAVSWPNSAGDAWGTYLITPPNAGMDLMLRQVDFSVAEWEHLAEVPALIASYHNTITAQGNMPDLSSPIFLPIDFFPAPWNETSGGDMGHHIEIIGPLPIPAGSPIWIVLFFGEGRGDAVGIDANGRAPGEAGVAHFQSTFWSTDSFASVKNSFNGNWVVGYKVEDAAGAFPSGGDRGLPCYAGWQRAALTEVFGR